MSTTKDEENKTYGNLSEKAIETHTNDVYDWSEWIDQNTPDKFHFHPKVVHVGWYLSKIEDRDSDNLNHEELTENIH